MIKSNKTGEEFVTSYNRPIYTIKGLSGVPEALLGLRSKSHGSTAEQFETEVEPFEDDDFFRESKKSYNPLSDTFFDFGGTNISLRNYDVILSYSGSRWFGTIGKLDLIVSENYNADYHAFW